MLGTPDSRGRAPRGRRQEECPLHICDGTGWILGEDNSATSCECRERMIGRSIGRGLGAGIPKRFQSVSFERKPIVDLEPMVIRHVKGYINNLDENIGQGRGLWFYGDVGTGKTSLAMLVAKTASKEGLSVVVYSVPQLLAEL